MEGQKEEPGVYQIAEECLETLIKKLRTGLGLAEAHAQTAQEMSMDPTMTFFYLDYLIKIHDPRIERLFVTYYQAVKETPDKTIDNQAQKIHSSIMAIIQPLTIERSEYRRLNYIEQGKLFKAITEKMGWNEGISYISKKFQVSHSTIKGRIRLLNLPEDKQELLIQKRITLQSAKEFLQDQREIKIKDMPKDAEPEPKEDEEYIIEPGTKCRINAEGEKNTIGLEEKILTIIDHRENTRLNQLVKSSNKRKDAIVIVTTPGEGPRPDQIIPIKAKFLTIIE